MNNRNGHKVIGAIGCMNKKATWILAVIGIITAIFLLWWKGCFLPMWISWERTCFSYEEAKVELRNRKVKLYINEPESAIGSEAGKVAWSTPWDWSVQSVQCFDVDGDGHKELVMLVWKHGSYGKHLPFWVKNNDIRLEQHLFVYRWEETRENRLRAVWMSSALDMKVASMISDNKNRLIVTDTQGVHTRWQWQQFGFKYAGEANEEQVTFLCAGDNLIHPQMLIGKEEYSSFYRNVKAEIERADIAVVNQETPFVKEKGLVSGYPRFGTPVEVGNALAEAGFDVVTLANNHILDKGIYGVQTTCTALEECGLTYLGVHPQKELQEQQNVVIRKENGIRIALLNYTYGTNGLPSPKEQPYLVERLKYEERMRQQLEDARNQADVVIVFVHWGTEYGTEIDGEQERYTSLFLEHGVDVVIGTHPHVLQKYEWKENAYQHKMLIYYSLGNFISAQDKEACNIGGLAEFTIRKSITGEISIENERLQKIETRYENGEYTVYCVQEEKEGVDE